MGLLRRLVADRRPLQQLLQRVHLRAQRLLLPLLVPQRLPQRPLRLARRLEQRPHRHRLLQARPDLLRRRCRCPFLFPLAQQGQQQRPRGLPARRLHGLEGGHSVGRERPEHALPRRHERPERPLEPRVGRRRGAAQHIPERRRGGGKVAYHPAGRVQHRVEGLRRDRSRVVLVQAGRRREAAAHVPRRPRPGQVGQSLEQRKGLGRVRRACRRLHLLLFLGSRRQQALLPRHRVGLPREQQHQERGGPQLRVGRRLRPKAPGHGPSVLLLVGVAVEERKSRLGPDDPLLQLRERGVRLGHAALLLQHTQHLVYAALHGAQQGRRLRRHGQRAVRRQRPRRVSQPQQEEVREPLRPPQRVDDAALVRRPVQPLHGRLGVPRVVGRIATAANVGPLREGQRRARPVRELLPRHLHLARQPAQGQFPLQRRRLPLHRRARQPRPDPRRADPGGRRLDACPRRRHTRRPEPFRLRPQRLHLAQHALRLVAHLAQRRRPLRHLPAQPVALRRQLLGQPPQPRQGPVLVARPHLGLPQRVLPLRELHRQPLQVPPEGLRLGGLLRLQLLRKLLRDLLGAGAWGVSEGRMGGSFLP